MERVFVDGAGGVPLSVGWLYGSGAQVAPDGVSGDAQSLGDLSQWDLVGINHFGPEGTGRQCQSGEQTNTIMTNSSKNTHHDHSTVMGGAPNSARSSRSIATRSAFKSTYLAT